MDASDLTLRQFLIRELSCKALPEELASLESMLRQQNKLRYQTDLLPEISERERQDALNVKLGPENFSHFRLHLSDEISFEVAKETLKRFYREAGYSITAYDDSVNRLLLEATLDTDVVRISCKLEKGNTLNILTA